MRVECCGACWRSVGRWVAVPMWCCFVMIRQQPRSKLTDTRFTYTTLCRSRFRNMHLYGSHTCSFINANNERFWVKFTFKTQQGIKNLTDAQACELVGKDRESSQIGRASCRERVCQYV